MEKDWIKKLLEKKKEKIKKFWRGLKEKGDTTSKVYIFLSTILLISFFLSFIYRILSFVVSKNLNEFVSLFNLLLLLLIMPLCLYLYSLFIQEDRKYFWFMFINLIFLLVSGLLFYFYVYSSGWEIIFYIFGILICVISYFLFLIYFSDCVKKVNWYLLFTILIILICFGIGMVLIDDVVGEKSIGFGLNNCTDVTQRLGGLHCSGIDGKCYCQ